MKPLIYHHSGCGTSKKVLNWLLTNFKEVVIIEYIKHPLNREQIIEILTKSGLCVTDILRKNDKVFLEKFSNNNLTEEEWIEAISKHPSILERPIVIIENKAYLARPFDKFIANFQ